MTIEEKFADYDARLKALGVVAKPEDYFKAGYLFGFAASPAASAQEIEEVASDYWPLNQEAFNATIDFAQNLVHSTPPAPTPPAQTLPTGVLYALRFYANGEHFHIDDKAQEFDTVSGEPSNWLWSGKEDDCTCIEDGGIARAVLQGKRIEADEDEPDPVEGEIYTAAP